MTFYSFDTSSILNGRRDLLPPTTFPTLWGKVEEMIDGGSVRSVDLVLDELARREGDETHRWAKEHGELFLPLTENVQEAVREVLNAHPRLIGVGNGRSGADPFVIALAKVHGGTVVTEESESRNLTRPKIPGACDALGVPRLNLMGFVLQQRWVF